MLTSVLTDWLFVCFLLSAGACVGWLACSIIAAGKLRRIQTDSWRAARLFYLRRYGQSD